MRVLGMQNPVSQRVLVINCFRHFMTPHQREIRWFFSRNCLVSTLELLTIAFARSYRKQFDASWALFQPAQTALIVRLDDDVYPKANH